MGNKLYIFFSYDVSNVGGVQLYMRAKALWLIQHGWIVKIVHSINGKILIKEYDYFCRLYMPEMFFPAYFYWNNKREQVLSKIQKYIGGTYSEFVIESHSYGLATWGELVAKHNNAKNFVYIIDENPIVDALGNEYMQFKYNRGEIAGIVNTTIPKLLESSNLEFSKGNCQLSAYHCNDCIFDIDFTSFVKQKGFTIGLFGRLEKEYMKNTSAEIIKFIRQCPNQYFNIIYVGGERDGSMIKNSLAEKYSDIQNADVYFTGFIFPIAKDFVDSFDVSISGAGAAWALTREGIPTIVVDPRDCLSSGILGVTTKASIFSDDDKKPISYWLQEVFSSKGKFIPKIMADNNEYDEHLLMIEKGSNEKKYNTVFFHCKGFYLIIQKLICSIFSAEYIIKILKIKALLVKKVKRYL